MSIQITRKLVIPAVLWAVLSAVLLGVMSHFDGRKESFSTQERALRNVQAGVQEVAAHVTSGIATRLDAASVAAAKTALDVDAKLGDVSNGGETLRQQFEEYYAAMVAVNSMFLENRGAEGEKRLGQLKADGSRMEKAIQTRIAELGGERDQGGTVGRTLHIVLLLAIAACILRIVIVVYAQSHAK